MLLKLGHFEKHTRNSFKYTNEATGNTEKIKKENLSVLACNIIYSFLRNNNFKNSFKLRILKYVSMIQWKMCQLGF